MKRFLITEEGYIGKEIEFSEKCASNTADFFVDEDGQLTLFRWSRSTKYAYVPEFINDKKVTGIFPLAFSSIHARRDVWDEYVENGCTSFSIFCMMNSSKILREEVDQGGPVEIFLPESICRIGQFSFWHCERLERIKIPPQVTLLREGTFCDCSKLKEILLPEKLEQIGMFYPETKQVMPDVGTFFGCCMLKKLTLPEKLVAIGKEVFNSCGITELSVRDYEDTRNGNKENWSRKFNIEQSAFHHTASLQWMNRLCGERVVWQIALPAGKDKILNCDEKYNIISRLPNEFFSTSPMQFDEIVKKAFRLDFAGRMAISRLNYSRFLNQEMKTWYLELLVQYFDRLDQFWPSKKNQQEQAFEIICKSDAFTAELLGKLMYLAGKAKVNTELLYKMQEVRNTRFSSITGLEDLDI